VINKFVLQIKYSEIWTIKSLFADVRNYQT